MFAFTPTHEITLLLDDDQCVDVEVQLVRGAAFTRQEWIEGKSASWQHACGRWSWCGQSLPPGCKGATFQSAAEAGFRRLAWELVDARIRIEGERLVLVRGTENEALLWLEVSGDRLGLADQDDKTALASDTTALQLRALVFEWRASRAPCTRIAPSTPRHPA